LIHALGFHEPIYAHIPLILNPDRSKMSKRFSDVALSNYREQGYLPEAIINFLALLGWHPKGDRELFSQDELAQEFDIERVQKGGAIFNQEKLDWLNREHMKMLSDDDLVAAAKSFIEKKYSDIDQALLRRIVLVQRGRVNTLGDFAEVGSFFLQLPDYEPKLLIWKEAPMAEVRDILASAQDFLATLPESDFNKETLTQAITGFIGTRNRGTVLWPLRVALSGLAASPDPIEIMVVLGKAESLRRVQIAIKKLSG
jgi:glutamyl/glutaminyl-tRNA synthetase